MQATHRRTSSTNSERIDEPNTAERSTGDETAPELVPSQPSTDGSNRATPPDSTHQFRLGPPLVAAHGAAVFGCIVLSSRCSLTGRVDPVWCVSVDTTGQVRFGRRPTARRLLFRARRAGTE
ncbi:hypothetical protein CYV19_05035 [Natronobacterium gregoryi SP2]|uniref:Uncharacterized protein n=1 Tax=Natronobacterium gregoryi (strain ATCC 43098 / DSM 3393 / CCM 3738 / CIP 104747 / IAM 13177 / JCM 8860 / NBRC 102187 / NCIMB 2189 / SP2) TaxID=797304 RepID=A0A2J4JHL7_NATGS|nr:hypothetical protein CYV19_05035 [Natronobacterium gregoryi SP2]